ncbi:MAG: hypothetical protein IJ400_07130 [Clostridia bacterium]|nr:hypothetical protein [Clostridia bacterium]
MENKNTAGKIVKIFLLITGACAAIAGVIVLATKFIKKHMRFSVEIFEDDEEKVTLENDIKITSNPIDNPEE